jgi:hypothetical protein
MVTQNPRSELRVRHRLDTPVGHGHLREFIEAVVVLDEER